MSNIYSEAQKEYLKLKEWYFNNKLHPNHLDGFKAMKKYFKDNTFEIHVPEEKEKRN